MNNFHCPETHVFFLLLFFCLICPVVLTWIILQKPVELRQIFSWTICFLLNVYLNHIQSYELICLKPQLKKSWRSSVPFICTYEWVAHGYRTDRALASHQENRYLLYIRAMKFLMGWAHMYYGIMICLETMITYSNECITINPSFALKLELLSELLL